MVIEKVTIQVARAIAGLTQKELAEKCNVSESTVANWENRRSDPTIIQAKAISKATGIPLDNIIFLPKITVKP